MTEEEWLTCQDPTRMMKYLGGRLTRRKRQEIPKLLRERLSARKLRLFGCACCRRVWGWLTSDAAKKAVEVAEMFADRRASETELYEAYEIARNTAPHNAPGWPANDAGVGGVIKAASEYPGFQAHQAVLNVSGTNFDYTADLAANAGENSEQEEAAQSRLFRCIVGNPFRPVGVEPRWLTSTAVALAEGIYQERAFDRMPILADALEDAGCDHADILNHCRQPGEHVRGCWVVDLLTGRK